MGIIRLKKNKEKKILNFYQWIFKDDIYEWIQSENNPAMINILDFDHNFVGKGFFNPRAAIPIRVISLKDEPIEKVLKWKIQRAINLRNMRQYCRLIFAEADFLPGLIADRYGDYVVMQIRNPMMANYSQIIAEELQKNLGLKGILLRNDYETLRERMSERNVEELYGKVPQEDIVIHENGISFYVNLWKGQKTGYFYDQRENRQLVKNMVTPGNKGLDLYSYTGSFAIHAAINGASVIAVDKSHDDIELGKKNADFNRVGQSVTFIKSDVLSFLQKSDEKFDFIIADPPGLAKKKQELRSMKTHLVDLGEECLKHLKPGGWMVLFSCSYLMNADFLRDVLRIAAANLKRPIFHLKTTHQPDDHPILMQMPETSYLTGIWIRGDEG